MGFVVKLIGAVLLMAVVALGIGVWDMAANGGRLFDRLAGRDALVADCTPPLRENLVGKGFAPVDLAFGDEASIGILAGSFGRSRSLSDAFTFSDGPNGPRIDGHVLCRVDGHSVEVEVDVDQLPRRMT